jgi:deoxyribonuclease (pyrimidine dimer)
MVRINLIDPKKLADQHLIAEYNEILMLIGHIKKFPIIYEIPQKYSLGKGHITFFKNKIKYLKERHELIKKEMRKRGFKTNKKILLSQFKKEQKQDWRAKKKDLEIIKKRLIQKIRLKPNYYRYYSEKKGKVFLIDLLE